MNIQPLTVIPVQNQQVPPTQKVMPVILDFTSLAAGETIDMDLSEFVRRGFIDMIQGIYVDMTGYPNALEVTFNGSNQSVTFKPNTAGYYPVFCPNPAKLSFAAQAGSPQITVFLYNFPVSGLVWDTQ